MSSYLPEKTYVVCTNQTGNDYRELLADSEKRNVSVFYRDKRAFLTIIDKKLNEDFTCKTSWSKGLAGGAFIGGGWISSSSSSDGCHIICFSLRWSCIRCSLRWLDSRRRNCFSCCWICFIQNIY